MLTHIVDNVTFFLDHSSYVPNLYSLQSVGDQFTALKPAALINHIQ